MSGQYSLCLIDLLLTNIPGESSFIVGSQFVRSAANAIQDTRQNKDGSEKYHVCVSCGYVWVSFGYVYGMFGV